MTVHKNIQLLNFHAFTSLRLLHAAYVDSYESWLPEHKMTVNRLLFVCSEGETESFVYDSGNKRKLLMRAGSIIFVPCGYFIDLKIDKHLTFSSLQFNLETGYGVNLFERHSRCELIEDPGLVAEVKTLMEKPFELSSLFRVNEIIYHLCAGFARLSATEINDMQNNFRKYEVVLNFIRKSADATTTVEQLADLHGTRRDIFSRNFSRDMGISPKDFLTDILIRKASEMLLHHGVSVKNVAQGLNFSSEYYFSHFFKRNTGMAPGTFQNLPQNRSGVR